MPRHDNHVSIKGLPNRRLRSQTLPVVISRATQTTHSWPTRSDCVVLADWKQLLKGWTHNHKTNNPTTTTTAIASTECYSARIPIVQATPGHTSFIPDPTERSPTLTLHRNNPRHRNRARTSRSHHQPPNDSRPDAVESIQCTHEIQSWDCYFGKLVLVEVGSCEAVGVTGGVEKPDLESDLVGVCIR